MSLAPIIVAMIYIANNVASGNRTNDGIQLIAEMDPIIGADGRRQSWAQFALSLMVIELLVGANGANHSIIGSICVKHIIGDM